VRPGRERDTTAACTDPDLLALIAAWVSDERRQPKGPADRPGPEINIHKSIYRRVRDPHVQRGSLRKPPYRLVRTNITSMLRRVIQHQPLCVWPQFTTKVQPLRPRENAGHHLNTGAPNPVHAVAQFALAVVGPEHPSNLTPAGPSVAHLPVPQLPRVELPQMRRHPPPTRINVPPGPLVQPLEHRRKISTPIRPRRAGLAEYVEFRLGDGGAALAAIGAGEVDLLFLDAERTEYPSWWRHPIRVLRRGGVLVGDNALPHPEEIAPLRALLEQNPQLAVTTISAGKGELVALRR
jgi:O-methyltransferase